MGARRSSASCVLLRRPRTANRSACGFSISRRPVTSSLSLEVSHEQISFYVSHIGPEIVYYVNAGSVYALGILFPALCSLLLVLRFMARKAQKVKIGPDDWMALAARVVLPSCGLRKRLSDS